MAHPRASDELDLQLGFAAPYAREVFQEQIDAINPVNEKFNDVRHHRLLPGFGVFDNQDSNLIALLLA